MKILPFVLLFISMNVLSQSDTIFLKDIVVKGKNKSKYSELKSKGPVVSFGNNLVDGFLSKYIDIPKGQLSTITLYFNAGLINIFGNNEKRQTVNFKLLIHGAEVDGSLGSSLYENELIFKVEKHHHGEITLDLKPLAVSTFPIMYFGIETLEKADSGNFAVMMQRNPETKTYIKTNNGSNWVKMHEGFQIKLKARIVD